MSGTVDIQADGDAVARRVAEWVLARALASGKRFAWCLSGGSTPKATFALLATAAFRDRFPWEHTHLFFGDERFVPQDHPDSNYRMAYEAMIGQVPIPSAQVHAWQTASDPGQSAHDYARMLQDFYGAATLDPARPLFDVTFLGLGEDGHTASLFPGVAALNERHDWTAAVIGAKPEPRLTLTYPVLDSSHAVAFLAAGAGKRAILARALAGDASLPAVGVKPVGELNWFVDKAAMGQ
jgi:6-phosphogluconolactonase